MIRITNNEALLAHQALAQLAQERVPAATALRIVRGLRLLSQAVDDVEQVRQQLLDQHARRDDAGQRLTEERDGLPHVVIEDQAAFDQDYNELMATEIEIDWSLSASELQGDVRPALLFALGPLLEEEKEVGDAH